VSQGVVKVLDEVAAAEDDLSFHLSGQAAGLNHEQTAPDLVRRLICEAAGIFGKLSGPGISGHWKAELDASTSVRPGMVAHPGSVGKSGLQQR